jgi:hypothetical protein
MKHNFMNIIAYRVRHKVSGTWYYIGENRLIKENNDSLRMTREADPVRA